MTCDPEKFEYLTVGRHDYIVRNRILKASQKIMSILFIYT